VGGASGNVPGGASYGSASQPVDFGSGGGFGSGSVVPGSAGGGAMRLHVGGVLEVDGELTAGGGPGIQDNSGGGSGGSIWVSAGTLSGVGLVEASGGAGQLDYGGGGAGGRIALYSLANDFYGSATAAGAAGDFPGGNGTVLQSSLVALLQVTSDSAIGTLTNALNSIVLYFNEAPNPSTVTIAAVSLMTPYGPVAPIGISMLSSTSYQVNLPQQTAVGNYTLTVGTNVQDLYGRPLSQAYMGIFAISLPVISGTVTDTNGNPIPGVVLQASGLSSAITDTNGNYNLGFVPGSSFTVTPSLTNLVFVPPSISYSNAASTIINQNYEGVTTIAPRLTATLGTGAINVSWQAISGVYYQLYSSPDLTNWTPSTASFTTNAGTVQIPMPITASPQQFYLIQSVNPALTY